MKKLLFYSLLSCLLVCCKKDDGEQPYIRLDPETKLNFPADKSGGTMTRVVKVSANYDWEFEKVATDVWYTVVKTETGANITVENNFGVDIRNAKITFKCKDRRADIEIEQLGSAPAVLIDPDQITANQKGGTYSVAVTANIPYEVINDSPWVKFKKTDKGIDFIVDSNTAIEERSGKIHLRSDGEDKATINVNQQSYASGAEAPKAAKVHINTAQASEVQNGYWIEKSYDDDLKTSYSSRWSGQTEFPVTLTYNFFNSADKIDNIALSFGSGMNGRFREFDIYVKPRDGDEKLYNSYEFTGEAGVCDIAVSIVKPEYVKFVVKSSCGGATGNVELSEIEFSKLSSAISYPSVFTDFSCSKLKTGTTKAQIDAITDPLYYYIASQLYNNTYEPEYRARTYKAIVPLSVTQEALRVSAAFSKYEGITGMYLEKGRHVVIVGPSHGKAISLRFPHWQRQPTPGYEPQKDPVGWGLKGQEVSLREGVNVIDVQYSTNAYLMYFDPAGANAPGITINFPTAKVNKFFDATKHTNADWKKMLDEAPGYVLDAVGEFVQAAFPVADYKKYSYNNGVELIKGFDDVFRSHYTFMGCFKYNIVPKNRMLARVNYNYFMFMDSDGVAFEGLPHVMKEIVSVGGARTSWGFAHEVGHALQMPQITWGGMMEVSNNLFSMYTTMKFGNTSGIKDKYAMARTTIIGKGISYLHSDDPFCKLVPFWQLHLYFTANGKPEFYADVMAAMRGRNDPGTGNNSYKRMLDFMKIACDVGQADLADFFNKWGFFYVGKITLEDYGTYTYDISQAEIDEVKSYISSKGYPQPNVDITTLED